MTQELAPDGSQLVFYFDAKDIQILLNAKPEYLLITSEVVKGSFGSVDVAIMTVKAGAFVKGKTQLGADQPGCPVPPCKPGIEGGGLKDKECQTEVERLLASYKANNFQQGFKL